MKKVIYHQTRPMKPVSKGITLLLDDWGQGNDDALELLMERVYQKLHTQAYYYLKHKPRDPGLTGTALVNETFIQLFSGKRKTWHSRLHFFATAAVIMKRLLSKHYQAHCRIQKVKGKIPDLEEDCQSWNKPQAQILANLEVGLNTLEKRDPRKAWVVRLHFYAGMTNQEIAEALHISDSTVKRELRFSRAWLGRFLT